LADAGDGNYSYIDNEREAKKVLQRQLSSTLATVAQDVKIQVEFNPATVKEYRLLGYENRVLNTEDFNNDRVDAGDIGAGHTVTALYEIILVGQKGWLNDSRYQPKPVGTLNHQQEYAYVNVRYKQPQHSQSLLLSQAVPAQSLSLAQASTDTRFAIAVAAYAQQLRGGQYNAQMQWDEILKLAQSAAQPDEFGLRAEFVDLVKTAKSLSAKPVQP
jgi:Ca-activated chloride channel family protein